MNYEIAKLNITRLFDSEKEVSLKLASKYRGWLQHWEQGYFIFHLLISRVRLHRSYGPVAGFISEAHSSIRTAFLAALNGYFPEAISLIRRTHESTIKAMYVRKYPTDLGKIMTKTSTQGFEAKLGLNLKWINNLESAYTHSDILQSIEIAKKLKTGDVKISYGPQHAETLDFEISANLSVFWILVNLCVFPKIFKGLLDISKIKDYDYTTTLLKNYLEGIKRKKLYHEYEKVEMIKF